MNVRTIAFALAGIGGLIAVAAPILSLLIYPQPPGCLDGPCVWIESRHGRAPLLASDALWTAIRYVIPSLLIFSGAILFLAAGRSRYHDGNRQAPSRTRSS